MLTIVKPRRAHRAYAVAAREFARLYRALTGRTAAFADDDGVPEAGDLVVIGSDSVNRFAAERVLDGRTDLAPLVYGGDGYTIKSGAEDGRRVLYLASGRGRSAIYAVYRYFEYYCGCSYFWDGDTLPPRTDIVWADVALSETPRFDYRGTRYFAHRSLHRFQAEMWGPEDWEREIDWLLKKRMNLFMLRLGLDDVFQKAFPDCVAYPSAVEKLPEAGKGFDDRTLFWPLEYRGVLRKRLLAYAFERDLMHPEDCGTMTHWYSRTPLDFLRAKTPKLLSQNSGIYSEQTGLVWDIADDANLDNYFALTAAHIREYGQAGLFHTIGLAERTYSDDREANLRLKKYVYRRICRYIQENYPGSRLLLASWDLYFTYTNDEVRRLLAELDREQVILFDYTSDSQTENSVLNWDVMGRFPWIFGIFQAYEPNSEIRNDYAFIERVMEKAKRDPLCVGFVLWPELSHADTFMLEYAAANAWAGEVIDARRFAEDFCRRRYGAQSEAMLPVRLAMLDVSAASVWSADDGARLKTDLFFNIFDHFAFTEGESAGRYDGLIELLEKTLACAPGLERALEKIDLTDERVRRDVWDIRRTLLGRRISLTILQIRRAYLAGEAFDALCESCLEQTEALQGLLAAHSDYSLRASLERLKTVAPVNPLFERTLKENANNMYCRSYIAELAADVYLPEQRLLFEALRTHSGTLDFRALCKADAAEISERFFAKPLNS